MAGYLISSDPLLDHQPLEPRQVDRPAWVGGLISLMSTWQRPERSMKQKLVVALPHNVGVRILAPPLKPEAEPRERGSDHVPKNAVERRMLTSRRIAISTGGYRKS